MTSQSRWQEQSIGRPAGGLVYLGPPGCWLYPHRLAKILPQ